MLGRLSILVVLGITSVPSFAQRAAELVAPDIYDAGDVGWCRANATRQLAELDKLSNELVALVELSKPSNRKNVASRANKIAEISRKAWNNIQYRRPKLPRPPEDVAAPAGPVDIAQAARAVRRLAVETRQAFLKEQHSAEIDVKEHQELLSKLERLNEVALGLSAVVAAR